MKQVLTEREKESLLDQPEPKYATELRNLLYLQLSLNHGMRRTEQMDLTWPRVNCQNGIIMVKDRLTNQVVKLSEPTVTLLKEWKGRRFCHSLSCRPFHSFSNVTVGSDSLTT